MRAQSNDGYHKICRNLSQVDDRFEYKNICIGKEGNTSHKRTYSEKARSNVFDLEYRSKEIFKVPYNKSFIREK